MTFIFSIIFSYIIIGFTHELVESFLNYQIGWSLFASFLRILKTIR